MSGVEAWSVFMPKIGVEVHALSRLDEFFHANHGNRPRFMHRSTIMLEDVWAS